MARALLGSELMRTQSTHCALWLALVLIEGGCGGRTVTSEARTDLDIPQAEGPETALDGPETELSEVCQIESAWSQTFGSPGQLFSQALKTDTGYLVQGRYFEQPGENSILVSLDADGRVLWNRSFNYRSGRLSHYEGGFLFGGWFKDDLWVSALDPDGTVQWEAQVGTEQDDELADIVVDGTSVVLLGSTSVYPSSISDLVVSRLDPAGQLEWTRVYGEQSNIIGQSRDERFISAEIDASGQVVIAAQRWMNGGHGPPWIFAIDRAGDIVWEYLDDTEYNRGSSWVFRQARGGGFLLGGNLPSSSAGGDEARFIRLDATGQVEWIAWLDSEPGAQQLVKDVVELDNGDWQILGYSSHTVTDRLWRLDSSGNLLFTDRLPGDGSNFDLLRQHPSGDFIVGGAQWGVERDDFVEVLKITDRGETLWSHISSAQGVTNLGALLVEPSGQILAVSSWSDDDLRQSRVELLEERCTPIEP